MPPPQQLAVASVKCYRDLLRQLRSVDARPVEDSSLLFQQAKDRVVLQLRLRSKRQGGAGLIDPKGAFTRLKSKATDAKANFKQLSSEKAERIRTAYAAARQKVVAAVDSDATTEKDGVAQRAGNSSLELAPGLASIVESNRFLRFLVTGSVYAASRAFMHGLTHTSIEGAAHMEAAIDRPAGQALITVSNHVASIDDPLITCSLMPARALLRDESVRWTLCATDRCFHNEWASTFFRAGKVLPVERGAGLNQLGMQAAEALLAAGQWVHIFPEGTRSRDGRLGPVRKGVGRLVASCERPPLVLPFVHEGMGDVVPRGAALPHPGQRVRVLVGEPIPVEDLLVTAKQQGWSEDQLHVALAERMASALHGLRQQMELGAGAAAEATAAAGALQLEVPTDDALMPLIEEEMQSLRATRRSSWRQRLGLGAASAQLQDRMLRDISQQQQQNVGPPHLAPCQANNSSSACAPEGGGGNGTGMAEPHGGANFVAAPADALRAAVLLGGPGAAYSAPAEHTAWRGAEAAPGSRPVLGSAVLEAARGYGRMRQDAMQRILAGVSTQ